MMPAAGDPANHHARQMTAWFFLLPAGLRRKSCGSNGPEELTQHGHCFYEPPDDGVYRGLDPFDVCRPDID